MHFMHFHKFVLNSKPCKFPLGPWVHNTVWAVWVLKREHVCEHNISQASLISQNLRQQGQPRAPQGTERLTCTCVYTRMLVCLHPSGSKEA